MPDPFSRCFVMTKTVRQHRIVKGGKLRKSESSLICVVIAEASTNVLPVFKCILAAVLLQGIQTINQLGRKQRSVSHVTSTSARNGYGSGYKIHKVSTAGTTAVDFQPRDTRFEHFSMLFCFEHWNSVNLNQLKLKHKKIFLIALNLNLCRNCAAN